jgi:DNA-binding winged helix-turn-helix (wHTH) protein
MANYYMRGGAFHRFRWLGSGKIPSQFDLRLSDWIFEEADEPSSECIAVAYVGEPSSAEWQAVLALPHDLRRFVMVIGSAAEQRRADLLKAGFGESVTDAIEYREFEARASRLAELTRWLPRHRRVGELELDLLAREAYGYGKPLNLNPREFALLWRLADQPGEPVSKQNLIQDVWRMGFVPETNSIAVHMSRLRRKLEFVGMSGVIATACAGGYCLRPPERRVGGAPVFAPSGASSLQPVLATL